MVEDHSPSKFYRACNAFPLKGHRPKLVRCTHQESSYIRLFNIPELRESIFQLLYPKALDALRLVNRWFPEQCSTFFTITFDVDNPRHYRDLLRMLSDTSASSATTALTRAREKDEEDHRPSLMDLSSSLD